MKRIFTFLIVALLLSTTSSVSFAERRSHHEGNRKEWNKGHDKKPANNKRPGGNNHQNGNNRPGNSAPRPGYGQQHKPSHSHSIATPPAARPHSPAVTHTPPPVHFHNALPGMVAYATRGCHDVNVWQISYDTYIVRYRHGNRFYTRYLYPSTGQYGPVNTISVNWTPRDVWSFIPPIQLNINI